MKDYFKYVVKIMQAYQFLNIASFESFFHVLIYEIQFYSIRVSKLWGTWRMNNWWPWFCLKDNVKYQVPVEVIATDTSYPLDLEQNGRNVELEVFVYPFFLTW